MAIGKTDGRTCSPVQTARISAMPRPLLVLGSLNADIYVEIDRLPLPGETIAGGGAAVWPGGKGANQAAAASRLGWSVQFAGQVGDDIHAPMLRTALTTAGVDDSLLATVPGPSGQALILLQAGGENSIIIVGGANRAWDDLPAEVAATIPSAAGLLLQREIPPEINLAAARLARRYDVPVIHDAGGEDAPFNDDILSYVDTISPNQTELARLTGLGTSDEAAIIAAARALLGHGPRQVLVKLGAQGSLLVTGTGRVLRQSIIPVPVVDTTGAGDCFTAAWTIATLRGLAAQACLRFASAAAACCIGVKGAMPSMPDAAAVESMLHRPPSGATPPA
jgi:ribokinase